jgi:hypothetical protein
MCQLYFLVALGCFRVRHPCRSSCDSGRVRNPQYVVDVARVHSTYSSPGTAPGDILNEGYAYDLVVFLWKY